MSLIVKFLHGEEYPGCEDELPCSIYSDVTSLHFPPIDKPGPALLWVREPIKTALVPGFVENRVNVDITGPVYVMNEQGKTISTYRPKTRRCGNDGAESEPDRMSLGDLPYGFAAALRRHAAKSGDNQLTAILDRDMVAVDAA